MTNKNADKISTKAPSLLKVLLLDVFVVHWLVSLLGVLLVLSSMLLAHTSHDTRRLTAQWQKLRDQQQSQQVLWESLRLEITSLAEANRISNLAKKQLGMIEVNTKNEKVISL